MDWPCQVNGGQSGLRLNPSSDYGPGFQKTHIYTSTILLGGSLIRPRQIFSNAILIGKHSLPIINSENFSRDSQVNVFVNDSVRMLSNLGSAPRISLGSDITPKKMSRISLRNVIF
ncbi:hypothetical protein OUZ56_012271 [Daphnia magna]|uniref:Uncharacterized protein n=1 Tax=Daphnia magna TaxID=35525 RepID=A0ABQ9Z2I0_9CRUS|nr:hypothetical protein OUZ56_012271 [Daphnia magna]